MSRALWIALALGCAAPSAHELRFEGERTLAACGQRRADTSLCLSVELLQAEYELCRRERGEGEPCDEVWQGLALWREPAPGLRPAPLRPLLLGR